jgi:4-diphosphocytidyl-2-C-methyl-D-erythritol kinase
MGSDVPGRRPEGALRVRRACPAKLNRFLAVLGRREDGFHELELVTTVLEGPPDLVDDLEAEPASALSLEIDGPTGEGLVADGSNLVLRAWRALEGAAGHPLPARLRLTKRIPHGAGLGGGSSDAAGALSLGNALFGLGLGPADLLDLAAELGSDVPLFLLGGTVLGLGRGERVFPLPGLPLEPILLTCPGLHVPTPQVYGALAGVGYPPPRPLPSLPPGGAPPWRNDLTAAALAVCPALEAVRTALAATGGEPLLCGSGSTWAARYATPGLRDRAVEALRLSHSAWRTWSLS